jgi:hypothetical protein
VAKFGQEPTVVDDRYPAFQRGIDGSKPRATIGARASSANFRVNVPQAGKVPQMCERPGHRLFAARQP